jgi:AAA+ ATPase superfamily predicted ATPase
MEVFIGREKELRVLQEALKADESAFLPVYGRRRVGKSLLLGHFLADLPGIYFLGKQAPAALQRREMLDEAARRLGEPLLAQVRAESWREVLQAIVQAYRGDGKLVLILDEFQWMAEASPELPSVLQELWDLEWRSKKRVMLILCGSYIGFMEREVLGEKSPLFGRRTGQILLRPFGYREAALFHPRFSRVDQARTYFVCGGMPYYLKQFESGRSFEQNLVRHVFTETSPLFREPDFLLREELREVSSYAAILAAIAAGKSTPSMIADGSGLDARKLPYYLQQLQDLGFVDRRYPLGSEPSPRQVRYELLDPLLRFWYRFVFPTQSALGLRGPEDTFRELIRPHLDWYCGTAFERLAREALVEIYRRDKVMSSFEIGEYWNKDAQIDVVGLRGDGVVDLGECKWGPVASPAALERDLQRKATSFPNQRGDSLALHVFCRAKPKTKKGAGEAVRWHDLAELYS